ncbi:MAG TPA: Bcr/CflA family multidrug efflux MFS transporter [Acetobacteraceae bacterium]|jgi:DHA1 family bicyclomycin/chloramphenicol resistance-like MFS transporter
MSDAIPAVPQVLPTARGASVEGKPPLRLLLALSALMSLGSLSTDMYLPALPTLGEAFGVSVATVQLTLTTFLAGFCGGQLIWGPIGDRYGRRIPAAIGLALFALGSAACAMSGTVGHMIAWRLFQAFGAASGPVLARAMVRDLYTREKAARMLSVLILVMSIAPLLGPILGGFVLVHWTWQGIFWVQAVLGLAGLAGLLTIRETLRPDNRTQLRVSEMVVGYIQLLGQRRLLGYGLASGFFYGAAYAYLAGTPFAYITLYHVPPQTYGWLFGLNIVGMMAMNALNSRLVGSVGGDLVLRYGIVVTAISGLAVAVDARFGFGGLIGLVVPVFVLISMNGAVVANSIAGALSAFPRKAGAASALVGAIQFGMGMLTTAATGWFANGTAFPYAAIIALAGIGGLVANIALVPAQRGA